MCQQCDTTMWTAHAPRRGYSVIQEEGKNFLMVLKEYQHRFPPLACTHAVASQQKIMVPPSFVQHVEQECAGDGMEYMLELDGECCPQYVDGERVHLRHCRCL
jgi:hypothetical protein